MRRKVSLKTNFKWMFISNIAFAFFQWLILISIAKMGDEKAVGIYTLGLAITAPVMIFSNLQLRAIQATDAKGENEFKDFLTLRFISMLFGLVVCLIIVFTNNYSLEIKLIIFVIAMSKSIEGLSDIIYGFLQKEEDMKKIALSLFLRGSLGFMFFLAGFYFTQSLLMATFCFTFSWVLVLIFWDIKKVREYGIRITLGWERKTLLTLLYTSLPLGIVAMLGSLHTNIPRYIIENQLSLEALGIFGALSYVLVGANKFTTSISQTVSPRLAKYYADDNKKDFLSLFNKILAINILFGLLGFLVIYFVGEEILTLIYSKEYAKQVILFRWIMLISMLTYVTTVFGVSITSMRIFSSQLPIHIIKIITVSVSSLFLIEKYGLTGAAWSLALSTLISIIFYYSLFRKGLTKLS